MFTLICFFKHEVLWKRRLHTLQVPVSCSGFLLCFIKNHILANLVLKISSRIQYIDTVLHYDASYKQPNCCSLKAACLRKWNLKGFSPVSILIWQVLFSTHKRILSPTPSYTHLVLLSYVLWYKHLKRIFAEIHLLQFSHRHGFFWGLLFIWIYRILTFTIYGNQVVGSRE